MAIFPKYETLQGMTDADLAKWYDSAIQIEIANNSLGSAAKYYLDEIVRRHNAKDTKNLMRAAWYTLWATIGALAVAIIALFK